MKRVGKHSRPSPRRHQLASPLVLSLVFALLGVSILFVTAHAYVVKRIETTLDDFYTGTFFYTGLLDIPTEGIDSVQLLPIGLTGDWQTSVHQLPQGLADLAAVRSEEWIYTIGGIIERIVDDCRKDPGMSDWQKNSIHVLFRFFYAQLEDAEKQLRFLGVLS